MEQHTGSQYDDDLTVGMDEYDDSFQTGNVDLFEFVSDEESPITRLKTLILSIDWEITDDILRQFNIELLDLKDIWANEKINLVYIQALEKISRYIYKEKANADPNAIKLLLQFYSNLEKIVSTESMPDEEKRRLLVEDVEKFEKFKKKISRSDSQTELRKTTAGAPSAEAPAFRSNGPLPLKEKSEDPLLNLKAIVFGMDWEITEADLINLGEEVRKLEKIFSNNKAKLIFLQGIGALGAYINLKRSNAHVDAFKLLHSFFLSLENIVRNNLTGEEEKKILMPEVEKFNAFKSVIAATISPEAIASEGEPDDEDGNFGYPAAGDDISPALADIPEDVRGFQEEEEAASLGYEAKQKVDGQIERFFDSEKPPAGDTASGVGLMEKNKNDLIDEMESRLDGFFGEDSTLPKIGGTSQAIALQGVNVETEADDDASEEALLRFGDELAPALAENFEESAFAEQAVADDLSGTVSSLESNWQGAGTETAPDETQNMRDITIALQGVQVETEADDDSEEEPLPLKGEELAPALFALDNETEDGTQEDLLEDEVSLGINGRLNEFFGDEQVSGIDEQVALQGVMTEDEEEAREEDEQPYEDVASSLQDLGHPVPHAGDEEIVVTAFKDEDELREDELPAEFEDHLKEFFEAGDEEFQLREETEGVSLAVEEQEEAPKEVSFAAEEPEEAPEEVSLAAEEPEEEPEEVSFAAEEPEEAPEEVSLAAEEPEEEPEEVSLAAEEPEEAPEEVSLAVEEPEEEAEEVSLAAEEPEEEAEEVSLAAEEPEEEPEEVSLAVEEPEEEPEEVSLAAEEPEEAPEEVSLAVEEPEEEAEEVSLAAEEPEEEAEEVSLAAEEPEEEPEEVSFAAEEPEEAPEEVSLAAEEPEEEPEEVSLAAEEPEEAPEEVSLAVEEPEEEAEEVSLAAEEPEEEAEEVSLAAEEPEEEPEEVSLAVEEPEEEPEEVSLAVEEPEEEAEEVSLAAEEPEEEAEEVSLAAEEPEEAPEERNVAAEEFSELEGDLFASEKPVFSTAIDEPAESLSVLQEDEDFVEYIEGIDFDSEEEELGVVFGSAGETEEVVFEAVDEENISEIETEEQVVFDEVQEDRDIFFTEQMSDKMGEEEPGKDNEYFGSSAVFGESLEEDQGVIGSEIRMEVFPEAPKSEQFHVPGVLGTALAAGGAGVFGTVVAEKGEGVYTGSELHATKDDDDPLSPLRDCVVTLGLESNDSILGSLFDEISKLNKLWISKPVEKIFLQLLTTVAQHIYDYRHESSPEAHSFLMSIFNKLELSCLPGVDLTEVQENLLSETSKVLLWQQKMIARTAKEQSNGLGPVFEDSTDDTKDGDFQPAFFSEPEREPDVIEKPSPDALDAEKVSRIVRDELESLRQSFRMEMAELLRQHLDKGPSRKNE